MEKIKVHLTLPRQTPVGGCEECGCKPKEIIGEWLWAIPINKNTVKLDNIPFCTNEYALGDLVEINENREIIRIIEKAARTRHIVYNSNGKREIISKRYRRIQDKLLKHDIYCEGAYAGVASISVPIDINDKELENIVSNSGAKLTTRLI